MKTEQIICTTSILAATALTRLRFVDFSGALPAAGERVLGVSNTDYSIGEQAGVATHGHLLVEAGAAIGEGTEVETDAQGRAVPKDTGVAAGVARDAATAAGEFIRITR